ncbi:Dihydroorotate dehydrogenase B (NAD(+)), electron transfer subunit [subsurface metagenome]
MPQNNEILGNMRIAPEVNRYRIYAPDIAKVRRAGQFVIIRIDDHGERIPLTIADADPDRGELILQEVGKTTAHLATLKAGDRLQDIVGPLGSPTHINNFGTVVMVGGGIGIAPCYPIAKAMKKAGNHIVTILGARTKDLLIMEDEMRKTSDEVNICTDDGSYGAKGLVTDLLKNYIEEQGNPDLSVAIGPVIMMKFVVETLRPYQIPVIVSLNPIMIDGTGMCGGCRVEVGGETKFVCVDGPEFDGYAVNFDLLMRRLTLYRKQEHEAYELFKRSHRCQIEAEL